MYPCTPTCIHAQEVLLEHFGIAPTAYAIPLLTSTPHTFPQCTHI